MNTRSIPDWMRIPIQSSPDPALLSPWMPTKLCYCNDPRCILNHRTLPAISRYDRRLLHMGADPSEVYQGEDLKLYKHIKAQEENDSTRTE